MTDRRCKCGSLASHRQGNSWLCPKHYRFGQMRSSAKRHGKTVPSTKELEGLLCPNMRCLDCHRVMNWLGKDNQTLVVTLQHYRNGSFGFVCRSCNSRHASMDGDSFCEMPSDHKYCPSCKLIKPFSDFCVNNSRSGPMKIKSSCRQCSAKNYKNWRITNRDYYNGKQKENRAKRNASR